MNKDKIVLKNETAVELEVAASLESMKAVFEDMTAVDQFWKSCTHYSDKYCFKSFQLHLPHSLFSGFSFNHFSVTFFQSFGTCSSVISPDLIFNP